MRWRSPRGERPTRRKGPLPHQGPAALDPGDGPDPGGWGISPGDRFWLLGVIFALMVVTTTPYGLAWLRQGEAWRFTGFLLGVEDGNSYIAKMLLGRSGAWLFRSPYTLMPQTGYLLFGPYLALGKLARWPGDVHTQLVILFHLFRLGALVALTLAVYRFSALFVPRGRWRRWAVGLILAGSGWDWVLLPWGRAAWGAADGPPSLISPESYGFLALFFLPHIALARALLLDVLAWGLASEGARATAWVMALETAGMVWVHPLEAVPWLLAVGLLVGLRWVVPRRERAELSLRSLVRWAKPWLPAGVVALGALGYLVALQRDPYVRLWTAQNRLPAPPVWVYLVGYGGLLPGWVAAWPEVRRRWHQGKATLLWLAAWAVVAVGLAVAPVPIQRRLIEGAWVGWVLMAMVGAARWATTERRRWGAMLALTPAFVAPALLLWGGFRVANSPALPAFRPTAEVQAFSALARRASPGDGVLAAYATGNALPAWAPVRVPLGLGPESAPWSDNEALVQTVLCGQGSSAQRLARLRTYGVRWVFFGPAERALGHWNPAEEPWLRQRYAAQGYALFEVVP
ncbi:MAG TPA: hypothetical protein G4O04_04360 [Anaerolineae bacterium]|nr:hypothetical protein [Anaerolineae bacterium]